MRRRVIFDDSDSYSSDVPVIPAKDPSPVKRPPPKKETPPPEIKQPPSQPSESSEVPVEEGEPPLTQVQPPQMPCFHLFKTKKNGIKGKRYFFKFSVGEQDLFFTKTKGHNPTHLVPILKDQDVHISSQNPDFTLLQSKKNVWVFSQGTKEVFTAKASRTGYNFSPPHLVIQFNDELTQEFGKVISRIPQMRRDGNRFLNLHDKFAVSSAKNMVFRSSIKGKKVDVLMIRKIAAGTFEIDPFEQFSPEVICGISLVVCLMKP